MAKKRKPNEMLSSVVEESAPDGAFDILLSNDRFVLPGDMGVILVLDTQSEEFGGLSAKQKRQEDKGAIIEQIRGDRIEALVTGEMLDEDALGLIPTEDTLDNMSDFSILVDANYAWGVVQMDEDGSLVVHTVQEATYDEAKRISDGEVSLREVMPEIWRWAAEGDEDHIEEDHEEYEEAVEEFESDFDDSPFDFSSDMDTGSIPSLAPLDEDEDVFEGTVESHPEPDWGDGAVDEDEVFYEDETGDTDDYIETDNEDYDEEADDEYSRYVDANADRDVSEEEVRDSIVRRFAPEDLDLVIDMNLFDETFDYPAPRLDYIPIGSEWMDNQVALMVEQANADLSAHHWDNMSKLREKFVTMASRYGEEVTKRMSMTLPGARFANMMDAAREDYDTSMRNSDKITAKERQEIIDRFDQEAETAAQAAAASARSRYEAQNRAHRERLLGEVGAKVDTQIEERFVANKAQVLELRASEAENWFDLGMTRVIEALSTQAEDSRASEADLMEAWNKKIDHFMDTYRKNDIARTEAMRNEQVRNKQVKELRQRQKAEIKKIRAENEMRVQDIESRMMALRKEHREELRARDEQWTSQLQSANLKVEQATALADSMRANLDSVRDVVAGQYEEHIKDLKREKRQISKKAEEDTKQIERNQKFVITIVILIAIFAVLASIAIGFVVGAKFNSSIQVAPVSGIEELVAYSADIV